MVVVIVPPPDPYILKLIREWLKAGVVHDSGVTYPDMGTPQGGVISPLLANITDDLRILSLAIVHPLFNPQGVQLVQVYVCKER